MPWGEERERPHWAPLSDPLTEDRFHQPRLEVNCLRTLQVLGVEPVGLLGEVTEHREQRPFSLLQLHERRKPPGSGHAAAGLAGSGCAAANPKAEVGTSCRSCGGARASFQGLLASPSPSAPFSLDSSPYLPNSAAGASSRDRPSALSRAPGRSRRGHCSGPALFPGSGSQRRSGRVGALSGKLASGRCGQPQRGREHPASGQYL